MKQDVNPEKVAEKLVTNKKDKLGKAIFQTSIPFLGSKAIEEFIKEDMPKEFADKQEFQDAVTKKLKGDHEFQNLARGHQGPRGQDGQPCLTGANGTPGANAVQVAEELVTKKKKELGEAIIDADADNVIPRKVAGNAALQNSVNTNYRLEESKKAWEIW
ncbi:MAG: collagen-like protein [Wolbachia sp.]|nr:collagen-like protein [Wolbachia sp.]MDD9335959.1 collagen-like protein [Wolbachia sp.]